MQTVSCPSCGAPVQFRSHASVMAVCEYCQTSVLKDADSVKDLGKMSSVLEDYSPIQIGTSGVFGGRGFSVVGRIQLRYSAGMWNEWYLLFEDGGTAWLGDSSGLYTLTRAITPGGALPRFADIVPGDMYRIGPEAWTAAEKRSAQCVGGQGELPFRVGAGWQAEVADFRSGSQFLTLDYSDGPTPVVYQGQAVSLDGLQCQLLRDDDAIAASAGKYKGRVAALDCPSCGSPVQYLPGLTGHLVCQACHSQIDAASPKAQVLAKGEEVERVSTTLRLGAQATINGQLHTVIGAMQRQDEEGNAWTEYLVYNTRNSFFWLVETPDGWWRANVMPDWPLWLSTASESVVADKTNFHKLYDYVASVTWAAGAFNWRVQVGDQVRVYEFEQGSTRLAAELTTEEMTWSRSVRLANDQVLAWFGKDVKAERMPSPRQRKSTLATLLWWLLALNAIPLLLEPGATWVYPVLGALAIYLPAKFLESSES
ncbi:DUF4178 domain-containing protein [Massilia sp. TS11]|uniref:DUF4178 domain-containing protein n=1 Tax=Massilia sp. TS11 TaxID=2908003 RepID=UPI001EDB55B4|nr:DUF4178 domain-containing protein [Massilia sp. TS11]MCG2585691.1 DUF4178 domain-containing protein [Massilia sp. TS11]